MKKSKTPYLRKRNSNTSRYSETTYSQTNVSSETSESKISLKPLIDTTTTYTQTNVSSEESEDKSSELLIDTKTTTYAQTSVSSEPTEIKMSLKLLIDTKGNRVLLAEAGKDFVDFLFHIVSLPVGIVINLLKKQEVVGSLANLYQSIKNLNDSYLQPNQTKDTLLKLVSPVSDFFYLLSLNEAPSPTVKNFYRCTCSQFAAYVTDDTSAVCPHCRRQMTTYVEYVAPPGDVSKEGGFVKGVMTYMVMDDLVVVPLSNISSITLLNKFNVKEVSALEEKVVSFGVDEAVKLLNASLHSKKVLTDVFLEGMVRSSETETNVDECYELT